MAVKFRNVRWKFSKWPSRKGRLFASEHNKVIGTYTVDASYITTYTILTGGSHTRKVLPLGTVLAINPVSQKVVPYFSSYGFEQLGVLVEDSEHGNYEGDGVEYDREVGVVIHGVLYENACWDNGVYGTVTDDTRTTLADRIDFVKKTSKTKWK